MTKPYDDFESGWDDNEKSCGAFSYGGTLDVTQLLLAGGATAQAWHERSDRWTSVLATCPDSVFLGHPTIKSVDDLTPQSVFVQTLEVFFITTSEGVLLKRDSDTWSAWWEGNGLPQSEVLADLDAKLYHPTLDSYYTGLGASGYDFVFENDNVAEASFIFRGDMDLYGGVGASWKDQVTGTVAAVQGSGTDVAKYHAPLDSAYAARFYNGGKSLHAAGLGDISTEHFFIEMILQPRTVGANPGLLERVVGGIGWRVIEISGTSLDFTIYDSGGGSGDMVIPMTDQLLQHFFLVVKRDGSAAAYLQGVYTSQRGMSGYQGSLSVTGDLQIGRRADGGTVCNTSLVWAGLWKSTVAPTTHRLDALAAKRAALWDSKYLARHVDGDASRVPEIMTRSSYKILERYEDGQARWFQLGNNALGTGRRLNAAGTQIIAGTDHWDQRSQLNPFPQTFNSWNSKVLLTITPDNKEGMFEGDSTMDLIVESSDGAPQSHYSGTTNLSWTSGTTYTAWGLVEYKSDGRPFIKFQLGANLAYAFYDLENGTIGSTGGSYFTTARISPDLGGGRYLIEMVYTPTATGGQVFYYQPCDANDSTTYTGDGRGCFWLECIQLEAGDSASPLIGAGATRAADTLAYKVPTEIQDLRKLALQVDMWTHKGSSGMVSTVATVAYPSSPAAKRHSIFWGFPTASKPGYYVQDGSVPCSIAGTSDITDGELHSVRVLADTDLFQLWVDGAMEAQDLSGSGPADQERLWIGSSYSAGSEIAGLIPRVTLDRRPLIVREDYNPEDV